VAFVARKAFGYANFVRKFSQKGSEERLFHCDCFRVVSAYNIRVAEGFASYERARFA
jgi:hypothetical protein